MKIFNNLLSFIWFTLSIIIIFCSHASDSFSDTWRGNIEQPNYGTYSAVLYLKRPFETLSKGDLSGKIDYPDFKCGGLLALTEIGVKEFTFKSKIQYGKSKCVDGGSINIMKTNSDRLIFRWYYPDGSAGAHGILEKSILAPMSTSYSTQVNEKDILAVTGEIINFNFKEDILFFKQELKDKRNKKVRVNYTIYGCPSVAPLMLLKGDEVDLKIKITGIKKHKYTGTFISWGDKIIHRKKIAEQVQLIEGKSKSYFIHGGEHIFSTHDYGGRIDQFLVKNVPENKGVYINHNDVIDINVKQTGLFTDYAPKPIYEFVSWGDNFSKKIKKAKNYPVIILKIPDREGIPFRSARHGKKDAVLNVRVPEEDRIETRKLSVYYSVYGARDNFPECSGRKVFPKDVVVKVFPGEDRDGILVDNIILKRSTFVSWGPLTVATVEAQQKKHDLEEKYMAEKARIAEETKRLAQLKKQQEAKKRRDRILAQKKASKELFIRFSKNNKLKIWPSATELSANPFIFEEDRVGLVIYFVKMLSKSEAHVNSSSNQFLVTDVPTNAFKTKVWALLACKVEGRKDSNTHLKYIDAYICKKSGCKDVFLWKN